MTEYILLAAMAAVIVLLLFLRTNTAVSYLALCAGSVLLLSSGENLGLVATSLTSGLGIASIVAKLILLFAPLVVCSFLLRGQISKGLLLFSLIPAICIACLGTVLAVPVLSGGLEESIRATETWNLLVQYQETFTGVGLIASIVMISMTIRRPHDKHGKKRH